MKKARKVDMLGSSPRAWGRCHRSCPAHPGFPVHPHVRGADGKTRLSIRRGSAVHPHVRGADNSSGATHGRPNSVHPHVRGADAACSLLPAPAAPVHPHVRGADSLLDYIGCKYARFIPRAWGRCHTRHDCERKPRFIPTCVGQIIHFDMPPNGQPGSSPRAWGRCFELFWQGCVPPVHPHVRGADAKFRPRADFSRRFIPTCVGQMTRPTPWYE